MADVLADGHAYAAQANKRLTSQAATRFRDIFSFELARVQFDLSSCAAAFRNSTPKAVRKLRQDRIEGLSICLARSEHEGASVQAMRDPRRSSRRCVQSRLSSESLQNLLARCARLPSASMLMYSDLSMTAQARPDQVPLPHDEADAEVELDKTDVDFVNEFGTSLGFLHDLNTKQLDKQVQRKAGKSKSQQPSIPSDSRSDSDSPETAYERNPRRRLQESKSAGDNSLPTKDLHGQLVYAKAKRDSQTAPSIKASCVAFNDQSPFVLCSQCRACDSCCTVTFLCSDCFDFQETCPCVRGTTAIRMQCLVTNCLVLAQSLSLHQMTLQREVILACWLRCVVTAALSQLLHTPPSLVVTYDFIQQCYMSSDVSLLR